MDPAKIAIRASTQVHLDIEDIKDDLVVLKDGSCCLVIATKAINFGLLSAREQEATIYAYASLLNSLTFPIQIVIRSQKKDISGYLKLLDEAERKESRRLIKEQIQKYRHFIKETVQKNEVLDKKFYIIIPMSALELGITKTLTATFTRRRGLPFDKAYILQKAKVNLHPKRDHLLRLLNRLNLKGQQLTTQELVKLFFTIYNPESTGQPIGEAEQYQTPLVQPAAPIVPGSPTGQASETPPLTEEAAESPLPSKPAIETVPDIDATQKSAIHDQISHLVNESVEK